jgi:hypothetical protein
MAYRDTVQLLSAELLAGHVLVHLDGIFNNLEASDIKLGQGIYNLHRLQRDCDDSLE